MKQKLCSALALLLCCLLLFSGCSGAIERLTDKVRALKSADNLRPVPVGIGLKVVPTQHFPKGFKTKYPLGQGSWTTEKPLIDPLGSESGYIRVKKSYSTGEIQYINQDYRLTKHTVAGDYWVLDLQDDAPDALLHLEQYILDLGGELLSPASDKIAFKVEEEDFTWWGSITSQQAIEIELYRERRLQVGKTLTITPADRAKNEGASGRLHFTTRHNGNAMQSLTVTMTNAEERDDIQIHAQGGYHAGGYKREIGYNVSLEARASSSKVFILDDIPQEPGDTLWDFLIDGDGVTVSFTLNEIAALEPVKYGEDLGALLVKGVPYGSVSVPVNNVDEHTYYSISHPDIAKGDEAFYGDQTPDGDTLFWLPSGYWNLNIYSDVLHTNSRARGIPVSEGELTVVEMASNLNSLFSTTSNSREGTTEHGMTFLDAPKERDGQIELKFLLYDSENQNAVPTKETTKIYENDVPVEIVSIERLDIPPSVVLLLDSSGSMAEQMRPAVEAAKAFVQMLPDNATVQVVDFDSTARKLDGTTKAEVQKSLDSAVAGGSTALYDAAIMGLELLQGAQRPTLVMFTDGKNEPAAGGLTDKNVVVEAIKSSDIPVYTIGFGKEHPPAHAAKGAPTDAAQDPDDKAPAIVSDLVDFAEISEGKYYSAEDPDALGKVFAAIAARLGNTYTAVYKRPQQATISDVPVVTVVLDCSGSMGQRIEGQGQKMQIAKDMFREFFIQMPDGIMTQLITFEDVWVEQVLTTDKAVMLQAISSLEGGGGTNIVDSARLAYDTLKSVPTSNRILVFLTDAAMEGKHNEKFGHLLTKIKEADIKSLWLGLGMEQEHDEENFAWASETAGGSYLLPNSAKELSDGLDKMLGEVRRKASTDKTVIGMDIVLQGADGKPQSYSGSIEETLSPLGDSGKKEAPPRAIKILTGQPAAQLFATKPSTNDEPDTPAPEDDFATYSPEVSKLLYGGDSPSTDTQIISRVPLAAKSKNTGIEITATEYYRLGKLRGIPAPKDMEYLAVKLQIENLFSDRPFQIPDITSHFYLDVNDLGSYPASVVTWLAQTPLANPGENAVKIDAGKTATGVLIFLVPSARLEDLQLNFYDIPHGHIQMILMGGNKIRGMELQKLSNTKPAKLSDTFTLTVKAYSDVNEIQQHRAPKDTVYRIVEGEITSNVQALLDIVPTERFFLNLVDGQGVVRLPISPVTGYIPMGYLQPKLLAPGSVTPIRWVFAVPKELAGASAGIYGDIAGSAIYIPVKGNSPLPPAGGDYKGEWFDVTVNELSLLSAEDFSYLQQRLVEKEPYDEEMAEEEYIEEEYAEEESLEEELVEEEYIEEEYIEEEDIEEEYIEEEDTEEEDTEEEDTEEEDTEEEDTEEEDTEEEDTEEEDAEEEDAEEESLEEEAVEEEYIEEEDDQGPVYVIADLTVHDKKDGFGTGDIATAFRFVSNRIGEGSAPGTITVDGVEQQGLGDFSADELIIPPHSLTDQLTLGIDGDWSVMDGESRRGLLVFELPNNRFTLQSGFIPKLKLAPQNKNFSRKGLLTQRIEIDWEDQSFAEAAAAEIEKVVRQYQGEQAAKEQNGDHKAEAATLIQSAGKHHVPFPSLNGIGTKRLAEPQTPEEVAALLQRLAWRPSYNNVPNQWQTNLSPQATLTQGWGNEADLAVLAEHLLAQLGLKTDRMAVCPTKEGIQALATYLKLEDPDKLAIETLPALTYRDAAGQYHLFVVPFMQEFSQLGGLVYLIQKEDDPIEVTSQTAIVSVAVEAIPLGDAANSGSLLDIGGQFGNLAGAMSGEEDVHDTDDATIPIEMLREEIALNTLSNDAVDIGFGVAQGEAYTAYMESPTGRIISKTVIAKEYYQPVSTKVTVTVSGEEYTHETILKKGETLDSIFTTVGINLPELPGAALKDLNEAVQVSHKNAQPPNEVSTLRWYTRNKLYRFIGAQTVFEDKLAFDLDLTIGRTTKPRCIAVTVRKQEKDAKIATSIDLVSVVNQIHNGSKEAADAFHIMSGLTASRMEGVALGKQGYDFSTIWAKAPKDATTFIITSDTAYEMIPTLRESGFPEKLLQNMQIAADQGDGKMFMVPDLPSEIDGQSRWAWLEVDAKTYETIAVLDTGEHGGFAEYTLLDVLKTPSGSAYVEFAVGAMVGVDVALWSECSAHLVTSDYKEAIKLAANYASSVSEYVHNFFDMMDAAKSAKELSPSGMGWKMKTADSPGSMIPGSAGGDAWMNRPPGKRYLQLQVDLPIPSIVDGFDAGLQFYFDKYKG
jgi:Mg-chelatase subunit ChlD